MSYTKQIMNYTGKLLPGMYRITVMENGISETRFVKKANKTNDCYSVAKAFTVTALGLLYDEGKLDTSETVADIFRERQWDIKDPQWNHVTLHMVMLHKWGIDKGFLDIDCEDIHTYGEIYGEKNDFLKIVLSRPLPLPLGSKMVYSDAAYYLLSRVVEKKAGEDLYDYLRKKLFNPMEFEETAWSRCPMGYSMGATGLFIRTEDMAKLGQLYLDKGMYKGQRILSQEWCDTVLQREYELKPTNRGAYCKGGMYGQMLYIDPARKLSVAWEGYDEEGYCDQMIAFLGRLS